ncbi:thiamine-phosphate kinase [Reinekea blandensis]|uniref:Thiamine-monophosphate kinase n=1 Tax=Reinekea blandensis MED297 TaxID=314283 RepID=A4BAR6_9GAMM|nr:thiamine-phosphate kinase [Reinekea blandensis]EAR11022.1 thiamine monophosphate kinase [Reinekea sp. MED297] [Reinekea blandensis MED297]
MNEFTLIQRCFQGWDITHPNVLQSIGDDCLVWSGSQPLVVSADTAVAGRHFPEWASPEQVAQRAFLPAVSDLAAMTATPAFFTLALTLPPATSEDWLTRFALRLRALAETYGIMLAGGDTTAGATLTLTLSVHGTCPHPVLRSGARSGDQIWVTGQLGQSAAALPYILEKREADAPRSWSEAYWNPQPPVLFASQLQGCIHSAIDLSDGLIGDAAHLARASECDLAIHLDRLPLENDLKQREDEGLKLALAGGDDYQLLFTADPVAEREIVALAAQAQVSVTKIGEVQAGKGDIRWYDSGLERQLPWQSFTHF